MIQSDLAGADPYKPTRLQLELAARLLAHMRSGTTRKECPQLWAAIHGRRFILPQYRQADYASQDRLNEDFEFSMLATAMGLLGFSDDVHHAMYSNSCGALWYDRPVLFLERELAEPLAESSLPEEMVVDDIEWPWPQVRILLPKGFLTIERDGEQRSMLFVDLVKL